MKTVLNILLALLMVSFFACGIKRDNPLDPHANSDIVIPGDVSNLQYNVEASGATRAIRLTWNSNNDNDTDGYYVYRSLGYYNAYAVVDSTLHVPDSGFQQFTHSSANDPSVAPGVYWYRISAYKNYAAGKLEGRPSTPLIVRIPN
jgi:hypothetical protein